MYCGNTYLYTGTDDPGRIGREKKSKITSIIPPRDLYCNLFIMRFFLKVQRILNEISSPNQHPCVYPRLPVHSVLKDLKISGLG